MHNPFTLFDSDRDWRPNPRVDEGLFHIGDVAFKLDTRTDPDDPWSGWLLDADIENGRGTIATPALTSDDSRVLATDVGGITDYTRGFLDARRYNRLGPKSQLNMRLVLGGWLGGDQLPLERRLSVDGPGALPGFGFRATPEANDVDVGTCNAGLPVSGIPAECDRIALAQMEYRGDLRLDLAADWLGLPHRYHGAHGDAVWVLFADAGRGWKVGTPEGTLVYDGSTLPALSTFRSDMGVGVDVSGIGIYVAKALSSPSQPWRFFFRLRHRF
jgi:hypothetical protein